MLVAWGFTYFTKFKNILPLQDIQALFMHSIMGHDLNPIGLIHCGIMLGDTQFIYTFIM